ncbi:outer membrane beta-barrel domain-containing protein [Pseudobacteriovorax antillogorgiicola]|uniref:Outer membrane beta-barrel protein n=1 Tax=Pseudobacteriovorax antillogorgiicola TaxID=1513793 RepID=A0A1Y6CFG9_9BACT|nr:outer membrane beta-barrel domain-containing protein [Pseudobacteriovorax antillogorgiicola]TCS47278.1 outer membrane beta-barrel protein [Pseudobacteriovorax antillogorgiicola]SMF62270.1 outer membrane beta-barrel protein [Pseudobacteriovorax antillogorgiicola]
MKLTNWLTKSVAGLLCLSFSCGDVLADQFEDVEIRVIRPRFFNKSNRLELGAELSTIMNETFIYTFMATGLAAYHFSESLAIEASLSYGFNVNKEDKRILFDEFEIKTQIFRTQFNGELALQWTPIYGKWQLASGRLIYFDTYVQGGFGTTGINWQYSDFCDEPDFEQNPDAEALPEDTTISYPTFMVGAGQRYFVSKTQAYKLDFRVHRFLYNTLDAECSPQQVQESGEFKDGFPHDTITLHFGTSFFF